MPNLSIVQANEIRSTGPQWNQWPANLPHIAYVTADGAFLCVTCANGGNGSEASTTADSDQWRIIGAQTNENFTDCAHCNRAIPWYRGDRIGAAPAARQVTEREADGGGSDDVSGL